MASTERAGDDVEGEGLTPAQTVERSFTLPKLTVHGLDLTALAQSAALACEYAYNGERNGIEAWSIESTTLACHCGVLADDLHTLVLALAASREGQSGPTLSDQPSTDVPERLGPERIP